MADLESFMTIEGDRSATEIPDKLEKAKNCLKAALQNLDALRNISVSSELTDAIEEITAELFKARLQLTNYRIDRQKEIQQ
jgi:hypothetical protein